MRHRHFLGGDQLESMWMGPKAKPGPKAIFVFLLD